MNILNELSFFSRTAAFLASFLCFSSALPAFLHAGIIFIKQLCNYLAANLRCLPCLLCFSPFCSRFTLLINYTNIMSFRGIISTKPHGTFGSLFRTCKQMRKFPVPVPLPLQCEGISIILVPVPVPFKLCLNRPSKGSATAQCLTRQNSIGAEHPSCATDTRTYLFLIVPSPI